MNFIYITGMTHTPTYASRADTDEFGPYTFNRDPGRPLLRFGGRIEDRPDALFPSQPGRYHLYAGWFCPWAHRSTLVIALAGLDDVVSVSYVHGERDGRGWAFRAPTGPDPVNGFALLRQAYDATEPHFDGHVSVPTLWDRTARRVVSNTYGSIDVDLATELRAYAEGGIDLYPPDLAAEIDGLDLWLGPAVNHGVAAAAVGEDPEARAVLVGTLGELDGRLADRAFLLGDRLTLADLRLWVTLLRFDAGANAAGAIGPRLDTYEHLWDWARAIYQRPEVEPTVDFSSFTAAGAPRLDWEAATRR